VHHLQEAATGVGHLQARCIHLRVNDAGLRVDVEGRSVLGVGQARHGADDRDATVGAHVAIDAGLGSQRRVARLALDDDLSALAVVDVGVAGRRPLDRGARHIAEPGKGGEVEVVAVLGPHRDHVEGQPEHVGRGDRADHRVGIGQGVCDRLGVLREVSALPDHGVRKPGWPDLTGLVERSEESEEVTAGGFRARDVQEVEHVWLLRLLPFHILDESQEEFWDTGLDADPDATPRRSSARDSLCIR